MLFPPSVHCGNERCLLLRHVSSMLCFARWCDRVNILHRKAVAPSLGDRKALTAALI